MPPFNDFPCADPLPGNFLSVAEIITDIGLDKAYCVFAELVHHHLSSAKLLCWKRRSARVVQRLEHLFPVVIATL